MLLMLRRGEKSFLLLRQKCKPVTTSATWRKSLKMGFQINDSIQRNRTDFQNIISKARQCHKCSLFYVCMNTFAPFFICKCIERLTYTG